MRFTKVWRGVILLPVVVVVEKLLGKEWIFPVVILCLVGFTIYLYKVR